MSLPPLDRSGAAPGPIGVFDSGYGGLTVLRQLVSRLPEYDFLYLGDNARAPYGSRSFPVVYEYTAEAVRALFGMGCHLVILACNTASAKALRTIQQKDLPRWDPDRRVLGVIRPTVEEIGRHTRSGHIGILGTPGTVLSESYVLEIRKLYPEVITTQEACPLWVPLVENLEYGNEGADYFIQKNVRNLLRRDPLIDTLLLGCTHYPLLLESIRKFVPSDVAIISQDRIVSESLTDYLRRHPEMDDRIRKAGFRRFLTTETEELFQERATLFFGSAVQADHLPLLHPA